MNMRYKMARALLAAFEKTDPGCWATPFEGDERFGHQVGFVGLDGQFDLLKATDAILDVMRVPDDGVGLVGQKTRDTGSGAACIWMDMIDAIKAGK